MTLPLKEALTELASSFTARLVPLSGNPQGKFQIKIEPPGGGVPSNVSVVVEAGSKMVMTTSKVDLTVAVKKVRFVTDAVADQTVLGGMPIAEFGDVPEKDLASGLTGTQVLLDLLARVTQGPLTDATKAPTPGVPGILATLDGTIELPMEVEVPDPEVRPAIFARLTLRDEAGNPVSEVRWTGAIETVANPIELDAQAMSRQLIGILTALTYEPNLEPPARPPRTKRFLHVEVKAVASNVDTGWVLLDRPVEVHLPLLPMPTVLACFRFNLYVGHCFVVLHEDSTLQDVQSVIDAIATAQTVVRTIKDSLYQANYLLPNLDALALALQANPYEVKIVFGNQPFLNDVTLQPATGIFGFLGNDMEAEDEISSVMLIGPHGRAAKFYNRPNFDDAEGQMNLSVGDNLVAMIEDTASTIPVSRPSKAVTVTKLPDTGGVGPIRYQRTFSNEISSIKLAGTSS